MTDLLRDYKEERMDDVQDMALYATGKDSAYHSYEDYESDMMDMSWDNVMRKDE